MSSTSRAPRLLALLLLLALVGVVLATFRDYGITTDEGVQHRYGRRIVRWYASLGADGEATRANDLYLYGGVFELGAQAAVALLPLEPYDARHLAGGLVGVVGVAAAWAMGSQIGGPWAGLFAGLFLALTPRFYGEMFANAKDVPFASLFALAAAVALRSSVRQPDARDVILTGLAVGLASGVRVAGLVLFPAVAVLWLACLWLGRREDGENARGDRAVRETVLALCGVLAIGWAVMISAWPWAQLDPLLNPLRAFRRFSRFWVDATVFYDGRFLLSGDLPRDYLPRLFALTMPGVYLVALALGGLALGSRLRRRPSLTSQGFRVLWVALLAFGPLGWVILQRTPIYNGVRHVLFVVPFLAVLAGLSAAAGLGRGPRAVRLAGASALGASLVLVLVDMVQLHPYQYVYFNRVVAGGLPRAAARYETDYLCASYKEGIEWMAREYLPGRRGPVRVDGNCSHVPFWQYLGRGTVETTPVEPHLFFATTTFADHRKAPGRVVHVVKRKGTPLLQVLEQRHPD